MTDITDEAIDLDAVASALKLHKRTIARLVSDGSLPSFAIGRRRRVLRSDLRAFIESRKLVTAQSINELAATREPVISRPAVIRGRDAARENL